jgi:hypothetical protein
VTTSAFALSTSRGGVSVVVRVVVALLAFVPFAAALGHPLFADDFIHIERAQHVRDTEFSVLGSSWILNARDTAAWWTPPELEIRYWRPLVTLSFLIDRALFGLHAAGYHLTNLALHAACTILWLGLAEKLLGGARGAFAAGALFAVHPCHAEAVLWASGRTDLLATFFVLAALAFELRETTAAGGRALERAASLVCFGLALASKEIAVVYPGLVALYGLYFRRDRPLLSRLRPAAPSLVLLFSYLALRYALFGGFSLPHPFGHPPGDPDWLVAGASSALLYLIDLVLFIPPDPVVLQPFWMSHLAVFALIVLVSLWLCRGTLRKIRDAATRDFGLAWIGLCLVPVLLVSVGERFLYLPSIGYCLLIGAGVDALAKAENERPDRSLVAVTGFVALVALARTVAFGRLAAGSQRAIDATLRAVDAAPFARAALVVDLPSASALGFSHALRLDRPERALDVEILTITPDFLQGTMRARSRVIEKAAGHYRIETPPSLWSSYIARAFRGPRTEFRAGERAMRPSLDVVVSGVDDGLPTTLDLELAPELRASTLLLQGAPDFQVVPLEATAVH